MFAINLKYLVFIFLLLSPIYLDAPLALYLGAAGNSPAFVLCYILMFWIFLTRQRIEYPKLAIRIIKLSFMILLIGTIANTIYMISTANTSFAHYSIFNKNIFVFLQALSYPLYLVLIYHYGKDLEINNIFKPIVFIFIFLAFFCVLEYIQIPNAFSYLHFNQPCPYSRIRLLTRESSWTAPIILNFFTLSLYYTVVYSKKFKFLILVSTLILFILTSSKNLIFASAIFIFFYAFFSRENLKLKKIPKYVFFAILIFFLLQKILQNLSVMLLDDIENYTSTATRSYTLITAFFVSLKYPLGVGGGLWQKIFIDVLKDNIALAQSIFPNLNYSEVLSYCSEVPREATAKSGLIQYGMYWGIVGTIIFTSSLVNFFKKIKKSYIPQKNILLTTLITNFILICFNADFGYDMIMFVGIVLILYKKKESEANVQISSHYS